MGRPPPPKRPPPPRPNSALPAAPRPGVAGAAAPRPGVAGAAAPRPGVAGAAAPHTSAPNPAAASSQPMAQPRASTPGASVPDPGEHALPQTFFLGRYRVVDEIGIGGMASVHLARMDGPGGFQKWVAIKRIHPHLVEDDQFVDMFLDEARIAAGINHANVVRVFDLGKDENTYWIAMEYLHGEPLREVMRRVDDKGQRLPFHIAARICADAAEGLHGAHELRGRTGQLLNLVHRDVTPHNLFCTYDGYTKVVDFGIAKVVDRLASTRAGTLKGKLAYMSPEQVRGQDVDRRTDIFALGVVLWELTTNRRLFRMETDLDTLEKVQACVVPLPSTIVPDYPPALQDVVMRALARRPEDRFQTARQFSRALQQFLMTQGVFVGPEDVGDYVNNLFRDRVAKREKYLEWAAEVTSNVDVEQLRAQQSAADASSLLASSAAPKEQPVTHQSYGQDSAAAAVVTTAPAHNEMAASSLMDEDEDIPTVVAQAHFGHLPEELGFDGAATQLVDTGDSDDLGSTIALPTADAVQLQQESARIGQASAAARANASGGPPLGAGPLGAGRPPMQMQQGHAAAGPGGVVAGSGASRAAIETRMSLPRPTAVAEWLAEQGEVQIHGPRTFGILLAIAALATLCVIGVGALVVYKLRLPPRGAPAPAVGGMQIVPFERDRAFAANQTALGMTRCSLPGEETLSPQVEVVARPCFKAVGLACDTASTRR